MNCQWKPLEFLLGTTYELKVTLYDPNAEPTECDPDTGLAPRNLTGATIYMTAWSDYPMNPGAVQLWQISTLTGDIDIYNPTGGQFKALIPTSATKNLVGSQLNSVYDVIVLLPNDDSVGKPGRVLAVHGTISLLPNVTPIP